MLNIILVVLVFAGIVLFQVPPLVKKQQWRELITSSVLLAIAFIFAFISALGVKIFG